MLPEQQEHHEMRLERTDNSGVEEWYCPECDRRFLMQWFPDYQQIILNPGNDMAAHSGGKGGLSIEEITIQEDDPNLDIYEEWLNNQGK